MVGTNTTADRKERQMEYGSRRRTSHTISLMVVGVSTQKRQQHMG